MAEIVNLRQARKRKALDEKRRRAEQNSALHGRTKQQRTHDDAQAVKVARFLEAHRRDTPGSADDGA